MMGWNHDDGFDSNACDVNANDTFAVYADTVDGLVEITRCDCFAHALYCYEQEWSPNGGICNLTRDGIFDEDNQLTDYQVGEVRDVDLRKRVANESPTLIPPPSAAVLPVGVQ